MLTELPFHSSFWCGITTFPGEETGICFLEFPAPLCQYGQAGSGLETESDVAIFILNPQKQENGDDINRKEGDLCNAGQQHENHGRRCLPPSLQHPVFV